MDTLAPSTGPNFGSTRLAKTNGFVTLRTEAWDAGGNRTVQTVTRAYALK
ncbi:hypothetical protein OHA28_11230 [Streptomyces sp. NBC_00269]|nr:hypothetical protein [Streptomyces sp. NBC_00269]